jgi:anaerobic selenocysteine-containing dehydrogenase
MSKIDRRDFLKLVGAGSIGTGAGFMLAETIKHPVEYLVPYAVPPEDFSPGIATWYNSVCSMCPSGCGISVRTREGRAKKIEGNPSHPVSQGRLCALGQAGLQSLYNPDRLTGPVLLTGERGSESYDLIDWAGGLDIVATRLRELQSQGQGDRIAMLSAGVRGHLADVFDVFMHELGSERLLYFDFDFPHNLYAANQQLFDQAQLPYYDLEHTRYLLSFGADYLGNWLSPVHYGLGFGRSRQGKLAPRGQFVQIEPRMSLSGAAADEWIAARPGTEGVLALGIAHYIVQRGAYNGADRDAWAEALEPYAIDAVATQTGVPAKTIARLSENFAGARPALAIGGGSAGNHTNGVDSLVAVNALNYLVGNIGQEGGLIFNPAPAFGPDPVSRQAGYRDMLDIAEAARAGQIEVLILNNCNPVFALPDAAEFAEAMASIPLIVSLSSFMDESTAIADLILPSHTYLESWSDDAPTPGVGFPVGAIAQPVVSPLYNTRSTGDIVLGLAHELGFDAALPWANMEECLRSGWQQIHERGAQDESFEEFWTAVLQAGAWGEKTGGTNTQATIRPAQISELGVAEPEFAGSEADYPFILHPYISNALRDGRAANLPWLQELPDPMTSIVYGTWVEINPVTAQELGVETGDLVEVVSPAGRISAPVFVYPAILPDVIAMPIGQGHELYGRYATGRGANPIQILAPQVDPHTGSLATSATRVQLIPTGKQAPVVRSGGTSRQLGRGIVRTTSDADAGHSAGLRSIPITVEPS